MGFLTPVGVRFLGGLAWAGCSAPLLDPRCLAVVRLFGAGQQRALL
jgi:hypothetical protein